MGHGPGEDKNPGAEQDYTACIQGDLDNLSFGVVIYDTIYTGYSRPGTSTVSIVALGGDEGVIRGGEMAFQSLMEDRADRS